MEELFQTFIGVDIKQGPLFVTFIRGGHQFMQHPLIQIQTQIQIRIHLQMHLISNKVLFLLLSLEGASVYVTPSARPP